MNQLVYWNVKRVLFTAQGLKAHGCFFVECNAGAQKNIALSSSEAMGDHLPPLNTVRPDMLHLCRVSPFFFGVRLTKFVAAVPKVWYAL